MKQVALLGSALFAVACLAAQVTGQEATPRFRTLRRGNGLEAPVTVRTLRLRNVTNLSPAAQEQIVQDVQRDARHLDEISERVRAGFQQHGYFKAPITTRLFIK